MKGTSQTKLACLQSVVEDRIKEKPVELDGHKWAAERQDWYCQKLGISAATLRRLTSRPPFVRNPRQIAGKMTTLLRMGEPDPMSAREYANIMSSIWRKKVGRRTKPREYGCICGLIEQWPQGKGPSILAAVLNNWDMFMAGVKPEMEDRRFLRFPSLTVIRRWPHLAFEVHLMLDQEKASKKAASKLSECIS